MIFIEYIQLVISKIYTKLIIKMGTRQNFKRFKIISIRNKELFQFTKSIYEYWLKNKKNFKLLIQDLDRFE